MEDKREVTRAMVEETLGEIKIPYIETSAKNNIRVSESFDELVRETRKFKAKQAAAVPVKKEETQKACCILL